MFFVYFIKWLEISALARKKVSLLYFDLRDGLPIPGVIQVSTSLLLWIMDGSNVIHKM